MSNANRTTKENPVRITTIQLESDSNLTRPFPFRVDEEGNVLDQDFWQGEPRSLMGFQEGDVQRVTLWQRDLHTDLQAAVGLSAVWLTDEGQLYSTRLPVQSITVAEVSE